MSGGRPVVVVGAGGFGREALDVVDAMNAVNSKPVFDVRGVVDDGPSEVNLSRLAVRNVPHLGTIDAILPQLAPGTAYVLGVGDPSLRARLDMALSAAGMEQVSVVHPNAGMGSQAVVGAGAVICAGVQVSTNVVLGRSAHLNPNATIGHDTVLGDYVSVNPGAIVSGNCHIGTGALLGAGSVVLQGLAVGEHALVGAAACVTRDLAANVVAIGVPARQIRRKA